MSEAIVASQLQIAHPLDEFYARARQPMPALQFIDAEEIPAPYKQLLVHEHDMTSTLEHFHEQRIHLRVLNREQRDNAYSREVVLELDGANTPVEFGAIKIYLMSFPSAARERILEAHWPLGRILKEFHIPYVSRPKAFLRIASDRLISGALQLTGTHRLYGRCNRLSDPHGNPLAEIVEILPPTDE
jgi:chorismate-pyruvate lyase